MNTFNNATGQKMVALIFAAMRAEADFSASVVVGLHTEHFRQTQSIMTMGLMNHFALSAYEGHRQLLRFDPVRAHEMAESAARITERARHSLKFFEDTKRGIDGQLEFFEAEIIPAHQKEFFGSTWLKPAEELETDLGIFRYEDAPILTTHSATYSMGLEPGSMFSNQNKSLTQDFVNEFSHYLAQMYSGPPADIPDFMKALDVEEFDLSDPEDLRSAEYYAKIFNGAATPGINALLVTFMVSLNFVDTVLVADQNRETLNYSIVKMRFVTLYQILRSLDLLRRERSAELTEDSKTFIDDLLSTESATYLTSDAGKRVRNTLVHYGPDSSIDVSAVDPGNLIDSYVTQLFPSSSTEEFLSTLSTGITETREMLFEWEGTQGKRQDMDSFEFIARVVELLEDAEDSDGDEA